MINIETGELTISGINIIPGSSIESLRKGDFGEFTYGADRGTGVAWVKCDNWHEKEFYFRFEFGFRKGLLKKVMIKLNKERFNPSEDSEMSDEEYEKEIDNIQIFREWVNTEISPSQLSPLGDSELSYYASLSWGDVFVGYDDRMETGTKIIIDYEKNLNPNRVDYWLIAILLIVFLLFWVLYVFGAY